MLAKKIVKSGLNVIFGLIQLFSLIIGSIIVYISYYLYLTINKIVKYFSPFAIFIPFIFGLSLIFSGVAGIRTMMKKSTFRTSIYILLIIILFNIEIVQILKINKYTDLIFTYPSKLWDLLSINQKIFIQDKFKCCGFENTFDRAESNCEYQTPCGTIFTNLSILVKSYVFTFLLILIVFESIGIFIVSYLNLLN